MENLAPAGNRTALERADAAGADAVYLGYTAFSARAGAGNFDRAELEEAIRYAHLRHMRVHVTVNTLVKDGELEEVTEVLRMLRDLRADAVLVQDPGILRIARSAFPGLAVHASTQMAIHNRSGVRWCAGKGIRRVVLARECSLEEIRKCRDAGTEIEVFAHGAQCVSVSGICLFSSMAGERSGNRGRCAQPCRQEYCYRGKWGAWLSPRDICLRDELPALAEAGVASVKLEGRLKRPEYVAVVTQSYRKALDGLEAGQFAPAGKAEAEGLRQIFNRGGFMKGYALGCEDAGVIDPETVNHQGIRIGRVSEGGSRLVKVKLEKPLSNGDGLTIRGKHGETDLIYAGPDLQRGETAAVRLREGVRAEAGDTVSRLTDVNQIREANAMKGRTVPADMMLRAMPGEPLRLTATDGTDAVTVTGEVTARAKTRAAEEEDLARSLAKTGETVFVPRKISVETRDAFIPVSQVNAIRREALEALGRKRADTFAPDTAGSGSVPEINLPRGEVPPTAYVRGREQAEACRRAGMRIVWDPEDWREASLAALAAETAKGDWLKLPDVCEEETLQGLHRFVRGQREKLGGVVLGTIGQLGLEWPVPIGAGPGIPVMNRQAAALLFDEGCEFVTASQELTGQELKTLTAGGAAIAVTVYGRTQLMLLHHCPARTAMGLKAGHRDCRMCDEGAPEALKGQALEDRRGYRFPLLRQRLPEGCLVRLMNAAPTDNLDKPAGNRTIVLTTENREETEKILAAFAEGRKTGGETTAGHWKRTVE